MMKRQGLMNKRKKMLETKHYFRDFTTWPKLNLMMLRMEVQTMSSSYLMREVIWARLIRT